MANGLAIYDRTRLEAAFGQGPYLHITLTPVGDRGSYKPTEKPSYRDYVDEPPNCYGLPEGSHGLHPTFPRYPGPVSDNYSEGGYTGSQTIELPTGSTGGAGSTKEQSEVRQLLALLTSSSNSGSVENVGLADELMGPMIRGMAVTPS
jgi:hypothetical protein